MCTLLTGNRTLVYIAIAITKVEKMCKLCESVICIDRDCLCQHFERCRVSLSGFFFSRGGIWEMNTGCVVVVTWRPRQKTTKPQRVRAYIVVFRISSLCPTMWREMKIDAPSICLIDAHTHTFTRTHADTQSTDTQTRSHISTLLAVSSLAVAVAVAPTYTSTLPHIPFRPECAPAASGSPPR